VSVDDLVPELFPVVASAAARWAKHFPMVDPEDVRQTLWVWVTRREEKVREYLEDGTTRRLRNRLESVARGYCESEKARVSGYSVDDLYYYSTETVRDLLPAVFDYEDWMPGSPGEVDGRRRQTLANEGNNILAMLADLSGALWSLPQEHQDVLTAVFRDNVPLEELAADAGVTEETYEKRVYRAIGRLRSRLGGQRPDFPRRRPSNATAQAILRSQWDG
jgi:DNA-directed RNA polymerase specialized sigma24 family protein